MYYGAPMDFGLPVTMASSRMSGPLRSSPPPSCPGSRPTRKAGSRCYTSILLEFPIFLYGLLHLLAVTFGIIILQSSRYSSFSTQEEVELLVVGCVGTAVSILGLMAVWFRFRHLLLPLLLFLVFIIMFDAVSIFAYFTNDSLENLRDSHYWYRRYMVARLVTQRVLLRLRQAGVQPCSHPSCHQSI
jgi:hypothetical protein